MPWKCKMCAHENADGAGSCAGCGEITLGSISLVSETSGKRLTMRIDTDVGKHILATLGDEDARFASDPQFRIVKAPDLGSWAVVSDPAAKNPTFLNGAALAPGPQKLEPGAVLSIGPEKLKMRVETAPD